jgi:hypothetical protein
MRTSWRKQKTVAMLINRKQWEREYDPAMSLELEIETEQGEFLITETSDTATPIYLRTE